MNHLDCDKVNNFLNKYFGFRLPTSKTVVAKTSQTHLKSFRDDWWDLFQSISGCLLSIQEGSVVIFWSFFLDF